MARLAAALGESSRRGLPPVERWNPAYCGEIDMRIAADGTWHYDGSPITRPALVRLFPGAIRYDMETWVVAHEDQRGVARIRATFIALVEGLSAYIGRSPMQRPAPANWG